MARSWCLAYKSHGEVRDACAENCPLENKTTTKTSVWHINLPLRIRRKCRCCPQTSTHRPRSTNWFRPFVHDIGVATVTYPLPSVRCCCHNWFSGVERWSVMVTLSFGLDLTIPISCAFHRSASMHCSNLTVTMLLFDCYLWPLPAFDWLMVVLQPLQQRPPMPTPRMADCSAMNSPSAAVTTVEMCLVYLPALEFDSAEMCLHLMEVIAVNATDSHELAAFAALSVASVAHSKSAAWFQFPLPPEPIDWREQGMYWNERVTKEFQQKWRNQTNGELTYQR